MTLPIARIEDVPESMLRASVKRWKRNSTGSLMDALNRHATCRAVWKKRMVTEAI